MKIELKEERVEVSLFFFFFDSLKIKPDDNDVRIFNPIRSHPILLKKYLHHYFF